MWVTTVAGSIPSGVLKHDTVFGRERRVREHLQAHRLEAGPERAARDRVTAEAVGEAFLQDETGGDSQGRVRWVGIETGWRRGLPSGMWPPREAGIQFSFQRRRS